MIADPERTMRMHGGEFELLGDEDSHLPDPPRPIHYIVGALILLAAFCLGVAI